MDHDFSTGTFARISGRVQGVNYRNTTARRAGELSLIGWVRNTDDGAVELLVGGDAPEVEELLMWCRKGPKRADVTGVDSRPASPEELATLPASGFTVRR